MRRVRLHDVAHSRAGDKGNLSTMSLIPYTDFWYPVLASLVTAEWVQQRLTRLFADVVRYELAGLPALLFVGRRTWPESVTTSLRRDGHGKGFSYALLGLCIDLDDWAGLVPRLPELPGRTDHQSGECP